MASSMAERSHAREQQDLAGIRATKLSPPLKAQVSATDFQAVVSEAIRAVSSQKAAAVDLGISEGRLSHKLSDGTLTARDLDELGPAVLTEIARRALEVFGPLSTPQSRMREAVRDIRRRCDEIDQYLEFIA